MLLLQNINPHFVSQVSYEFREKFLIHINTVSIKWPYLTELTKLIKNLICGAFGSRDSEMLTEI